MKVHRFARPAACVKVYTLAETPVRWKCSAAGRKFSVTSGTIFHSPQAGDPRLLAVIALFANGVKGTSALEMTPGHEHQPKAAFVLLHKLREAMGAEIVDRAGADPAK